MLDNALLHDRGVRMAASAKARSAFPAPFEPDLVLDSMLELAVFHELVTGPDGRPVDYRILECNPAFTRITGIERWMAVGRLASEVYGGLAPYLDTFARVATTGKPFRFDTYFEPLDRHFSISVVSPRPGFFFTIASDVTERHRAAVVLQRYELLAQHGQDIMLFVRAEDGRVLEANAAACLAYGYSRGELLTMRIEALRPPESADLVLAQLARAREEGLRFEAVHVRKDGTRFPVEVTTSAASLGDERVVVSVIRDVTERAAARDALRRGEAELRTILENITSGVVVAHLDDSFMQWNAAALAMHGIAGDAEPPRTFAQLARSFPVFAPDGARLSDEERPLARVLRGEHLRDVEIEVRPVDGGWARTFSYSGKLVLDAGGNPSLAVVTIRDRTEERKLHARLASAQRLETVGRLAGGIAHDFNNILTVVLSCAEAIKSDLRQGILPSMEEVEEIVSAGSRAAALTKQLLAFGRKGVIDPATVDLNDLVRGTEKMLRRTLGEDIVLSTELQAELWPTTCDAGQLEQVILNLAINARDAMPGGGQLTLQTRNMEPEAPDREPGGGRVRLTVRDTGTGMSPEVKRLAFEPFFTTKPVGHGTGLGLATAYGIVKQSGGYIRVESEPGKGSAFDIYLPRAAGPKVERERPQPAPARGGSERILVVEDDSQVRAVLVGALRAGGYDVIARSGAREALEQGGAGGVQLLVTDVIMPELTGPALADALRARHPGLKVLFVSGYTGEAIARHGVLEAGVELLSKPFTPAALLARVRQVLDSA